MSTILVDPQTEGETVFEWTLDPATKGLVKITLKNSYGRRCKCCGCNCPCRCMLFKPLEMPIVFGDKNVDRRLHNSP